MKLRAAFKRIAPGVRTEELSIGWVAVSHLFISDKRERRKLRGKLVRIKSAHGTIYRTLKFSSRLKHGEAQILLDWDGWITICDDENEAGQVEVEITLASAFGKVYHSMSHPDPAYRHSMAVARIGIYIAIISLIVSLK